MFGLYRLKDWNNVCKTMKASTIKNKIEKATKNKKNLLFAPPSEIIRTCSKKCFPYEYMEEIKILLIEYFSKMETEEFDLFLEKNEDRQAVYYAYNSLCEKDNERVKNAKNKFLESFLIGIERNTYLYILYTDETYNEIRNNWIRRKKEKLENEANLNFQELKVILNKDFKRTIKEAEEKGLLKGKSRTCEETSKEISENNSEKQTHVLKKVLTPNNKKRSLY